MRARTQRGTTIKSNNPQLAGGEQLCPPSARSKRTTPANVCIFAGRRSSHPPRLERIYEVWSLVVFICKPPVHYHKTSDFQLVKFPVTIASDFPLQLSCHKQLSLVKSPLDTTSGFICEFPWHECKYMQLQVCVDVFWPQPQPTAKKSEASTPHHLLQARSPSSSHVASVSKRKSSKPIFSFSCDHETLACLLAFVGQGGVRNGSRWMNEFDRTHAAQLFRSRGEASWRQCQALPKIQPASAQAHNCVESTLPRINSWPNQNCDHGEGPPTSTEHHSYNNSGVIPHRTKKTFVFGPLVYKTAETKQDTCKTASWENPRICKAWMGFVKLKRRFVELSGGR